MSKVYEKMQQQRQKAYSNLTHDQKVVICDALRAWGMLQGSYESMQHPDFEEIVTMSRIMLRLDRVLTGGGHYE